MDELYRQLTDGVTVLTASRRLTHALRIAYATHAQAQGLKAWRTPAVMPWTVWLRQQWLEARANPSSARSLRLLSPTQARLLWEQIVTADPLAQTLLNPAAAARVAQRSWRRMHEYLIDLERLGAADTLEAQSLLGWSREFIGRCDTLGVLDEARLPHWAWDTHFMPDASLAFAGFDSHPPALQRLIERWQTAGAIRPVAAAPPARSIRVVALQDREAEVLAAARWARAQAEAGSDGVAVILADLPARHEEVRRAFETVFTPAARSIDTDAGDAPFIIAAPGALSQFPLVAAALALLRLVQGSADSLLAGTLLRSPFLRGAEAERDARALADARLREEQRERWDLFELERWAGLTACTQLELALRDAARLARELPRHAPPSVWSERLHALLRAVGWPGERTLSSVEQQTAVKFQAALAELGSLDAVASALTIVQALRELQRIALDTPFEPETPVAAVTIIDPVTSAGMIFDAVWIAGLDATRLPTPVNPDPLIPLSLQRAAGLPESNAESHFAHSRVRLQRLLSSAQDVTLSWPQTEGDAELQMSPLLRELPVAEPPPLSSDADWQHAIFAARPSLEVCADDRAPELQERVARGGARTLELQSLCAFRAQAEVRLRAQPLKRVASGMEPADRGNLIHRVLASIWTELGDQSGLLARPRAVLETRVRELAIQHAGRVLPAATRPRIRLSSLAVEHVTQQVLALLDIDRQRPTFAVHRVESDELYTIGGLQLRLKLDRIDRLAAGWLVVDYKSGRDNEPKDWIDRVPERPRKPQLPLYALAHREALAGVAFGVLAPGTVEYRGLSNGTPIGPGVDAYADAARYWYDAPADWDGLLQRWERSLTSLAERYVAGDAPVDPLPQACTYCHLSTFCRIHERDAMDADEGGADDE